MSGGTFAAGDWVFSSQAITVAGANLSQDLSGLAVGDVNASYVPSASGGAFTKQIASISLDNDAIQKVAPKGSFEVPVKVSSDMALGAMSLKITFPSDVVTYKGISSKLNGFVSCADEGSVTIGWYGDKAAQLKANDALVTLKFSAKVAKGTARIAVDPTSEFAGEDGAVISAKLSAATAEITNVPTEFALGQNYPNPFNPSTQINYDLPQAGMVTLTVYNLMGQEVSKLVNEHKAAGSYSVQWNAMNLASGMYVYRINVQTEKDVVTATKRLVLLK
jgi:hypothetical protein